MNPPPKSLAFHLRHIAMKQFGDLSIPSDRLGDTIENLFILILEDLQAHLAALERRTREALAAAQRQPQHPLQKIDRFVAELDEVKRLRAELAEERATAQRLRSAIKADKAELARFDEQLAALKAELKKSRPQTRPRNELPYRQVNFVRETLRKDEIFRQMEIDATIFAEGDPELGFDIGYALEAPSVPDEFWSLYRYGTGRPKRHR